MTIDAAQDVLYDVWTEDRPVGRNMTQASAEKFASAFADGRVVAQKPCGTCRLVGTVYGHHGIPLHLGWFSPDAATFEAMKARGTIYPADYEKRLDARERARDVLERLLDPTRSPVPAEVVADAAVEIDALRKTLAELRRHHDRACGDDPCDLRSPVARTDQP